MYCYKYTFNSNLLREALNICRTVETVETNAAAFVIIVSFLLLLCCCDAVLLYDVLDVGWKEHVLIVFQLQLYNIITVMPTTTY